jgi:hypothetical protein
MKISPDPKTGGLFFDLDEEEAAELQRRIAEHKGPGPLQITTADLKTKQNDPHPQAPRGD